MNIIFLRSASSWTPARLFAASEVGAWYDPSDLSTMWKDTAGTTPVTSDGDLVARIDDKSGNGFHATQSTEAARPLYKTSGGLHWLELDGSDDVLSSGAVTQLVGPWEFWAGLNITTRNIGAENGILTLSVVGGTVTTAASEGIYQRSDVVERLFVGSRITAEASYVATLNSAFTVGTPVVARAEAQTGPDQIKITSPAGNATTAAAYTGTPTTTNTFNIGSPSSVTVLRFYGGLAIDRALTSGEAALLQAAFDSKIGL